MTGNRLARNSPIVVIDAHAVLEALAEGGIKNATTTSSMNGLDEANE